MNRYRVTVYVGPSNIQFITALFDADTDQHAIVKATLRVVDIARERHIMRNAFRFTLEQVVNCSKLRRVFPVVKDMPIEATVWARSHG